MTSASRSTTALVVMVLAVTSSTMACGASVVVQGGGPDSTVRSVIISPPGPVGMNLGTKLTFTASVFGASNLTDHGVTWSLTNARIATVDQTGVLTADSVGTTTIIATARANPQVSGAVVVTIAVPVSIIP